MDASDGNGITGEASMDVSDSRKRPMDSDLDQSIAKRSNRGDCKLMSPLIRYNLLTELVYWIGR